MISGDGWYKIFVSDTDSLKAIEAVNDKILDSDPNFKYKVFYAKTKNPSPHEYKATNL